MKTQCPECGRRFSRENMDYLFADGEYYLMCPICALEITREIHGYPEYMFTGEALRKYDRAVKEVTENVQERGNP
jgi:hypothetical protein